MSSVRNQIEKIGFGNIGLRKIGLNVNCPVCATAIDEHCDYKVIHRTKEWKAIEICSTKCIKKIRGLK